MGIIEGREPSASLGERPADHQIRYFREGRGRRVWEGWGLILGGEGDTHYPNEIQGDPTNVGSGPGVIKIETHSGLKRNRSTYFRSGTRRKGRDG